MNEVRETCGCGAEGQEIYVDEIDFDAALAAVLPKVRERLIGDEALQAGADAICGELPANEGDRNEVRIEIEAAFDAAFPGEDSDSKESLSERVERLEEELVQAERAVEAKRQMDGP